MEMEHPVENRNEHTIHTDNGEMYPQIKYKIVYKVNTKSKKKKKKRKKNIPWFKYNLFQLTLDVIGIFYIIFGIFKVHIKQINNEKLISADMLYLLELMGRQLRCSYKGILVCFIS